MCARALRLRHSLPARWQSLFEPLTMQTIHWLTASKDGAASPAVAAMLEAAMEAVSHASHAGLREFGARCLGEFVAYSIKHKSKTSSRSPHAVRSLLVRLYALARHPDGLQRLSFAFAIGACYRQLREDTDSTRHLASPRPS